MASRSILPVDFPIDRIIVRNRLRSLNEANVAGLIVGIEENGFQGAITLRPVPSEEGESYCELVLGLHRLTAMKRRGAATIPAVVRVMTDDEARQAEIDENLIRADLSPLERAEMIEARFAVYARRFPDRVVKTDDGLKAKRGRPEKGANFAQLGTMGFAAETAAHIGLSPKTVKNAWAMVNGIPAETRKKLHGTWLAKNDGALRQLASIADREEQGRVVAELLDGSRTTNVSEARAYANGNAPVQPAETPADAFVKDVMKLWGKATPSHRAALLDTLAGKPLPKGYRIVREGANG